MKTLASRRTLSTICIETHKSVKSVSHIVKSVYDVVSTYEDLTDDGDLQLSRHAKKRSERRDFPTQFLLTALSEEELVGAVVQPPEHRFKIWLPMPDEAPMEYSEDKDLVLVIEETEIDKTHNLITTYPERRSKRFHDD